MRQCPHVSVEMRQVDPELPSAINLRPQFALHLRDFCVLCNLVFVQRQISLRVQQAADLVCWAYRPPAILSPLAVERQVDSKVGIWMRLCPACHLRKPGAGNQDAGRGHPAVLERVEDCMVDAVRAGEVISVENQQASGCRITQSLLNGWCGALTQTENRAHDSADEYQEMRGSPESHQHPPNKCESNARWGY